MFKVLDEACKPTKGSKYSAAVDLYAREEVIIEAGETKIVPLGVCIDENFFIYEIGNINVTCNGEIKSDENSSDKIDTFIKSHYLQLEPRSSLRADGLIVGTGIIDMDYKDEIKIIIHNQSMKKVFVPLAGHENVGNRHMIENDRYIIKKGKKIAQILLKEHKTYLMGIESEEERTGGFGSTGN